MKKLAMSLLLAILFPTVVTLAWTGSVGGAGKSARSGSGRKILMDRGTGFSSMDAEEYLVGIVAKQIPADFGKEALKAQAIVARTYVWGIMGENREIPESSLDLDYPEEKQRKAMWGEEKAAEYYENIKEAVEETKGKVIIYDGEMIIPLFHRASAGKTRDKGEDMPYIKSVASPRDVEADGFLQMFIFTPEEFVSRIREIPDAGELSFENVFSQIQMVSSEEAGYVQEIQIGTKSYTGEEVECALGLPSSSFVLEPFEGSSIRAVVKGIGHGYGMSQYGARTRAEEGWTAEEILAFFYPGTEVTDMP